MTVKLYSAEYKALDDSTGTFSFYASTFGKPNDKGVFGPVDKMGDTMHPQSFNRTLTERRSLNQRMPVAWAHAMVDGIPGADPMRIIAHADPDDVVANDRGLLVKAQMDMENPLGVQTYKLMKRGIVNQASFSYSVQKSKTQKDGSTLIQDVDLYEAGPCMVGVNGATEVVAVKAMIEEALGGEEVDDGEVLASAKAAELEEIEQFELRLRMIKAAARI